ncbi:Uncharacterised protein [uncultured archaeon]|nr:Uncharacterised protein [uncultured archaeon]
MGMMVIALIVRPTQLRERLMALTIMMALMIMSLYQNRPHLQQALTLEACLPGLRQQSQEARIEELL